MILTFTCLVTLFLLALGSIAQGMRTFGSVHMSRHIVLTLTFFSAMTQMMTLYQLIHTDHGINLGLFSVLSLVTWAIIIIVLLSSIKELSDNLLILVLPIAFITVLSAWLIPTERIITKPVPLLVAHILLSIIASGLLTAAACQAALLSWQETRLRSHDTSTLARVLPPLQTMEKLMFAFLLGGHILLTLSLISGFIFYDNMFAPNLFHKTMLSISAWFLFSTILVGHHQWGWRGNIVARWIIIGVILLVMAFLGWRMLINQQLITS